MERDQFIIAGPLYLDRNLMKARSAHNHEFDFNEDEFKALYLLASQEGMAVSFSNLYKAVWDKGNGTDRLEAARHGLENIMKIINAADGFLMRVAYCPLEGYTFQTRWSHNMDEWSSSDAHIEI